MSRLNPNQAMEYELTYKPDINNKQKVRIFGKRFVRRNKIKCMIIYKNLQYELKEYFEDISLIYNHKDKFIIILRIIKTITNMSHMFAECDSLIAIKPLAQSGNSSTIEKIIVIFMLIIMILKKKI